MRDADNTLFEMFREEARTHAATLAQGLVVLEGGGRAQQIEPLMRAAHSIKGAARIVNAEQAVPLAHTMEDALVAAQQGKVTLLAEDIDLLLRGADLLAALAEE